MSSQITIMLPYVYAGINTDYISHIIGQLGIGTIKGTDMRQVGDHQQAFIHMDNIDIKNPSISALNEGQTLEVTYDAHGHYWKMVKYIRRGPSPETHARVIQMAAEREAREAKAIQASIATQEQRKIDEFTAEFEAEQAHIDAVVAGTADYKFEPTADQQAEKIQHVIDILNDAKTRPTLLTKEEKAALVRKFAEMMFYL